MTSVDPIKDVVRRSVKVSECDMYIFIYIYIYIYIYIQLNYGTGKFI